MAAAGGSGGSEDSKAFLVPCGRRSEKRSVDSSWTKEEEAEVLKRREKASSVEEMICEGGGYSSKAVLVPCGGRRDKRSSLESSLSTKEEELELDLLKKKREQHENKSVVGSDDSTEVVVPRGSESDKRSLETLEEELERLKKQRSETKSQTFQTAEEEEIIKVGDTVDISRLLFTKDRDFLVNRDGIKVTVDELKGKVLIIHVIKLLYSHDKQLRKVKLLIETYNQLKGVTEHGGFEVVIVATGDDHYLSACHSRTTRLAEERFEEIFQDMPFLAIPFHDRQARERVEARLGVSGFASKWFTLIDSSGKLLAKDVTSVIETFGPEGFPFSDERIQEIYDEEEEAFHKLSLESLLATANRNFLIDNEGNKVPIHTLTHKVVGLYFYDNYPFNRPLNNLTQAYEKLKSQHENFEIVIVYMWFDGDDEQSFWKSFKSMPWLALPFKDPKCKKLARIFDYDSLGPGPFPDNSLAIIGPYGSYFEPYGADILKRYGIDAYPYTKEKATEIEMTSLKNMDLNSLFDAEVVFRDNDQTEICLSELCRKRVLVLLGNRTKGFESNLFLMMLRQTYKKSKGTDEEFEVIYIGVCKTSYKESVIQEMPWLVLPFSEGLIDSIRSIRRRLFRTNVPEAGIAAFEQDGKLVAKEYNVLSKTTWNDTFPYIDKDLKKHTLADLLTAYEWDYQYDDSELEELGAFV